MRIRGHHPALAAVVLLAALALQGCGSSSCQVGSYEQARRQQLETIKAGRFDNGRMWTFDHPPLDYFEQTYGFRPSQQWLDDARLSALRFGNGCSASFVSADGLVMTNHHCARGYAASVQKEGEHILNDGFYAASQAEERRIPDLSVDQLVEIRDVTADVLGAMDAATTDEARVKARDEKIRQLTAENTKDDRRGQVVTFYNGGKYSLYVYRRYTDVRLVCMPELRMAHFGGEFDNFTFPRYGLDFTFVRVYDKEGKPLRPGTFFRWSAAGAKENELVFVVGNPGRTNRLNTVAQLEYYRDVQYPATVAMLNNRMEAMLLYAEKHPEKKDAMHTDILGVSNGQKAYTGYLAGLRDDELMQRKRDFERQFRAAVDAKPELRGKYGKVWDEIAASRTQMRTLAPELNGLRVAGITPLATRADLLLRYALEMRKPEADRGENYKGTKAADAKKALLATDPSDTDMNVLLLERQLGVMLAQLGADDPVVAATLAGRTPARAAQEMIAGTTLGNAAAFSALVEGDPQAVLASSDPLIALARAAQPRYDAARDAAMKMSASDVVNNTLLGRAIYDVYGTAIPPDATFTLRLADGVVKGYEYNGTKAPAFTTFYGMYDRNASFPGEESWELSKRWFPVPEGLDLATPLDFASTNDIIGGNSGSPMINKNQEVVGLIFDGNIESLAGNVIFAEDKANRTVSVHSAGILATLKHVLKATRVAQELETGVMVP